MKKTYILATIVFSIGIIMLFGTSYSLITNSVISNETYGFNVANFDVEFMDNTKISISGIPTEDEDGLKNGKEFSFTVSNNSDYDVNYRIDVIEMGGMNMSKVIHYVYSINDSEYSDVFTLSDNSTIKQNKVLRKNALDVYKIKMWLSIDADESFMNKNFLASISLDATQNEYKYATNVIEKLFEKEQDGIKKINDEYRYSLKNSSNYVWFNCEEGFSKGVDYCNKWRIIGALKNNSENSKEEYLMLKIVDTNIAAEIPFNNSEKNSSYDNSYISTYANGYYYDELSEGTKDLIMNAKWNIGNVKSNTYEESLKEEKTKEYYGNIGLLNNSDYLYLLNESYLNSDNVLLINKNEESVNYLSNTITTGISTNNYGFLPTVFLRPDVSIISGDGSFDNPYELSIKYPMNY